MQYGLKTIKIIGIKFKLIVTERFPFLTVNIAVKLVIGKCPNIFRNYAKLNYIH